MPVYEYVCGACKKRFSLTLTLSEHDKKRIKCPKCESTRVKQQISSFFAVTNSKS